MPHFFDSLSKESFFYLRVKLLIIPGVKDTYSFEQGNKKPHLNMVSTVEDNKKSSINVC